MSMFIEYPIDFVGFRNLHHNQKRLEKLWKVGCQGEKIYEKFSLDMGVISSCREHGFS
jgi:hypothetical protein